MTAQHTPGPWRLSGPDHFYDYTIQGPTEELAIAAAVNGEMRRMGGELAEHEANARLIAAAPELLEALQAVVRVRDKAAFDQARAAIRKATGTSDAARFPTAQV